MKRLYYYLFFVILTGCYSQASAQFTVNYKQLGDASFEKGDYYAASVYYKKALSGGKDSTSVLPYHVEKIKKSDAAYRTDYLTYQLGESYRLYNDFSSAEQAYGHVAEINPSAFPLVKLWYGITLRANQKYEKALEQLRQFKSSYNKTDANYERVDREIASCEFAIDAMKYPKLYSIVKLQGAVNSMGGSNYSPIFMDDNHLAFTSSRPVTGTNRRTDPFINNVYIATGSDFVTANVKPLGIPTATGTEQGTPAFSLDRKTVYFTRWTKKDNVKKYGIYMSKKLSDDKWGNPVRLNSAINAEGSNSLQPFITSDGSYMYFTSDRPGGYGKRDIWYAKILPSGECESATNLGPEINTSGNDEAVFYDILNKHLIFTNDSRPGMGNGDFFESYGGVNGWQKPQNMGYPINSSKDDGYWTIGSIGRNEFYISSDRESTCCLEVFLVKKRNLAIGGKVLDCDTNGPLEGALVTLIDSIKQTTIQEVTTGANGTYRFAIDTKKPYEILFSKKDYFGKRAQVSVGQINKADTLIDASVCLKGYQINKPIELKNIYYDFGKATLREESKNELDKLVTLMKDTKKIVIELSSHTDSIGSEAYNLKLSEDRAKSCVDYLISRDISPDRVISKGYGKSMPIAPNSKPNGADNPEGRQRNRRTEFKVLKN